MLRRAFAAVVGIALSAACGGESKRIDVRHPPKALKALANIVPSKPVTISEISASCADGGRLRVTIQCEATIASSKSMMRKAHLHLLSGGFALLSYTARGGNDAIRMKLTDEEPAEIPVRQAGGILSISCSNCSIEPRPE